MVLEKSTLAKTIFGLLQPNQGRIRFKGQEINGLKSNQIVTLGMGYVPQITNIFQSLTIEENLEMGAFILTGSLQSPKDRIFTIFRVLRNVVAKKPELYRVGNAKC